MDAADTAIHQAGNREPAENRGRSIVGMPFQLKSEIEQLRAVESSPGEFIERGQQTDAQCRAISESPRDWHVAGKANLGSEWFYLLALKEQPCHVFEQLDQRFPRFDRDILSK